jgi:hypothetical protein
MTLETHLYPRLQMKKIINYPRPEGEGGQSRRMRAVKGTHAERNNIMVSKIIRMIINLTKSYLWEK